MVPLSIRNLWRVLWNWITAVVWWFSIPVTVFHRTSTIPMPRDLSFPFVFRTAVYQAHSSVRGPSGEVAWISPTKLSHSMGSGKSFRVASCIQDRRCSTLIPDGPPDLFQQRRQTAQATSSSSGMPSSPHFHNLEFI